MMLESVSIHSAGAMIDGDLSLPENAAGIVLFVHGSGSSRHSPRNRFVAQKLQTVGLGTLLIDLLTPEEDADYPRRFDIPLLVRRLAGALAWLGQHPGTQGLRVGLFGASTGAAAAVELAASYPEDIVAVVSRGGRPDLASDTALRTVRAPTLLIVGGLDDEVIDLNEAARARMRCEVQVEIIPGATHLFEEPGTLEQVAHIAAQWLSRHLRSAGSGGPRDRPG